MLHGSSMLCVEPQDSFFESGFFTEHQAAQAAAGHLGVRVREIERKSCKYDAANNCVGVYKTVSRAGTVRWRARSAGGKRFSSCSAAASEEARSRGVVVKKLRKTKGRQLFVRELKTRFKAMMPLYDGVTFSDSETTPMPRLPADLESAQLHARVSLDMFLAEPALLLISLQMKCPSVKDILRQAWISCGRPTHECSLTCRTKALRKILVAVARKCNNLQMDAFIDNCGRNVSYVLGPIAVFLRLRIIQKATRVGIARRGVRRARVLNMGKCCQSKYVVSTSPRAVQQSHSLLARVVRASSVISEFALQDRAMTVKLLIAYSKNASVKLKRIGAPMLTQSYTRLWTLRSLFIAFHDGRHCNWSNSTIQDFMAAFPDQGQWLKRITTAFKNGNYSPRCKPKDVMRFAGFRLKQLHLFSMFACFLAAPDLAPYDFAVVEKRRPELWKIMCKYRKAHAMWPIPAVLLRAAQDEGVL